LAKEQEMAKSYYSIALNHAAAEVWAVIHPFDHYAWAGVESETIIEGGKAGDQTAAVRRVTMGDKVIRQVLLAHSDVDRSYTYAFADAAPFPVQNYTATIRVTPIVETNHAFVEWWATFDCARTTRSLDALFRDGRLCALAGRSARVHGEQAAGLSAEGSLTPLFIHVSSNNIEIIE